jgi:hypothetical protein
MNQPKQNWIVRMKCIVLKDVYVENCTEDQARSSPFEFASEEQEVDMSDWEVKSVEPNT